MIKKESRGRITLATIVACSMSLACEERRSVAAAADAAVLPPTPTTATDAGVSPNPGVPTVIFQAKVPSHKIVCNCTCNAGNGGKEKQLIDVPQGGDCSTLNNIACTKKEMGGALEKCFKDSVEIPKGRVGVGPIDGLAVADQ